MKETRMPIRVGKVCLIALPIVLLLGITSIFAADEFSGAPYSDRDLYADTWVATDALGRVQPSFAETGPVRENKFVGIFYWTWHIPRGTYSVMGGAEGLCAANGMVYPASEQEIMLVNAGDRDGPYLQAACDRPGDSGDAYFSNDLVYVAYKQSGPWIFRYETSASTRPTWDLHR